MDISFDTNNLEISEVYKGLLEKPSSNNLEIDEEVVFYHINHGTLGKQVCCMKFGFINPKPTDKIFTFLLCRDASQRVFKCIVEVIIKFSTSSRVFLCSADIMENALQSDVNILIKNDDFLPFVSSNKFRVNHVRRKMNKTELVQE